MASARSAFDARSGAAAAGGQPKPAAPRRLPDALEAPGVRLRRPPHPGHFLERHYLKPLALSQSEAARQLGVSRRRLHELVHGQRRMSADTALRCARRFGLPAAAWLALQAEWDGHQAWLAQRAAG